VIDVSEQAPPTIESFYKFVAEGKLMGVKCKRCGHLMVPPRPMCDKCMSKEVEWVQLKGEGEVVSFTVISVPPAQFASLAPYAVAVVKLDEGPKIPGIVKGATQPSQLKIGMRVRAGLRESPVATNVASVVEVLLRAPLSVMSLFLSMLVTSITFKFCPS
jgi:uncharacterized OB-fold protein